MKRPLKRTPPSRSVCKPAGNSSAEGNVVPTTDSRWVERLLILHRQVRDAVMEFKDVVSGARNARGSGRTVSELLVSATSPGS